MTTKKSAEVDRRKKQPEALLYTFADDFRERLSEQVDSLTRVRLPSPKWRKNPVGFFREVLGIQPWERTRADGIGQVDIINAYRDHMRVAVRSGHKVSKSNTAGGIGLHFYSSFDDARVIMTSTTARQVDAILWREVRMMKARSGRCLDCKLRDPEGHEIPSPCPHSAIIDGDIGELARTGLKSEDFREIVGFTAREAEAVAGISGKNLLYILDEASGIKSEIFEAIEGNRAGGARVVMFSNPTRTSGEFYEAFKTKKKFYCCLAISSEDTPNVVYGKDDPRSVDGLANKEWIEEKKEEWGEDSPLYKVRIKGEFAELEGAKIFPVHKITESQEAWKAASKDGRLFIGLDPAGDSEASDDTCWVMRRALKMQELLCKQGLSPQSILVHTIGMVTENRLHDREIPVVVMDVEGEIGHKVYNVFAAYLNQTKAPPFELIALRSSDGAQRNPIVYDTVRDELAANLVQWMNSGGAILEDVKLDRELNALYWVEQEKTGKVKLVGKKILRKKPPVGIGRSPGRYDALSMAVWEPLSVIDEKPKREEVNTKREQTKKREAMDPYSPFDPYR
jgi:phage terminase large subunit